MLKKACWEGPHKIIFRVSRKIGHVYSEKAACTGILMESNFFINALIVVKNGHGQSACSFRFVSFLCFSLGVVNFDRSCAQEVACYRRARCLGMLGLNPTN